MTSKPDDDMRTKTYLTHITKETIPTSFAFQISKSVGIIPMDNGTNGIEMTDAEIRLKNFQQMSVACPFNEAMIAFYGYDFSEEQMKALEIIHKSTTPWLLGATVGILLDRINNSKITNKDFAIAVNSILEQIGATGADGNPNATNGMKRLVYEYAGLKPGKNNL